MRCEVESYLKNALDIEVIENDRLIIFLENKTIIIKNISENDIEKCYEIFSKNFASAKKNKKIYWTIEEITYLKENYMLLEIEELIKNLNKSLYQINLMLIKLKMVEKKNWTNEELEFLERNIQENSTWLANQLNRSIASVKSKKRVIRLSNKK